MPVRGLDAFVSGVSPAVVAPSSAIKKPSVAGIDPNTPPHPVPAPVTHRGMPAGTALRGTTVAIDGLEYLASRMRRCRARGKGDPFRKAVGGVPGPLLEAVARDVAQLQQLGVRPLFVFSGLAVDPHKLADAEATAKGAAPPVQQAAVHAKESAKAQHRLAAWESFYAGKVDQAAETLLELEKGFPQAVLPTLFDYFNQQQVEWMRAPCLAWAQIAWLLKQNIVQHAWAPLEVLLFGSFPVILDIDFETSTMDYVDAARLLQVTGLRHDQLVDACLLAGSEYCPTFPPLRRQQQKQQGAMFASAVEMVKACTTGVAAIESYSQDDSYMETFARAKGFIIHHPVFKPNYSCETLNADACPVDIDTVIGARLPDDVYYFVCMGIVSPQVVNNLITGEQVESPPFVDTEEYQQLLGELLFLRSRTLGILSSSLSDFFRRRRISWHRYFMPNDILQFDHHLTTQPLPDFVNLADAEIESELERQHGTRSGRATPPTIISSSVAAAKPTVDMAFVMSMQANRSALQPPDAPILQYLYSETDISDTNPPSPPTIEPIRTLKGTLAYVLTHCLVEMEHLTPEGRLTTVGSGLEQALRSRAGRTFQEQCLVVLELLRAGYLTANPLTVVTGSYNVEFDKTTKPIRLISRIFSLLPIQLNTQAWPSMDYDLMGFHCIVMTLWRSLRNLLEMVTLSLYLRHRIEIPARQLYELSRRLPFNYQPGTELGIVCKVLLERCTGTGAYAGKAPSNPTIAELTAQFPACANLVADLRSGLRFWEEVMHVVQFLHEGSLLNAELRDDFVQANALLVPTLKAVLSSTGEARKQF
eukprot:TRINITY_DN666_c0_g1_i3.p1 TRINITY_DN666_c0_g1~~TRINITY_DN666_c0_g1_i3.p1  ORF type:complete len:837 (-),score=217.82 TRINITY_DN666_c0_g1_i3:877-3327(-)